MPKPEGVCARTDLRYLRNSTECIKGRRDSRAVDAQNRSQIEHGIRDLLVGQRLVHEDLRFPARVFRRRAEIRDGSGVTSHGWATITLLPTGLLMQRFTISLDDTLAAQFDALLLLKGYVNRSEAVRDLIRAGINTTQTTAGGASWSVATVSYIYSHDEHKALARLLDLQHEHHDLVVAAQHTHLDHEDSLECIILRGPSKAVRAFGEALLALRGVRHGNLHLVPVKPAGHSHSHEHTPQLRHVHHTPLS